MHWRHSGSLCKKILKQTLLAGKVLCTVLWDTLGILLVDFLARGGTVNAEYYYETLQKLRRSIRNKRRGKFCAGIFLLHDNARPQTVRRSTQLQDFSYEVFNRQLYSTDLAPSDFHIFLHLKNFLSGQRFQNDREAEMSVIQWFQSQAENFYDKRIQKLVPRYEKCFSSQGEFVEK